MHLAHHGIKGQKWGVRRYQNPDGTLTEEGKERYLYMGRARNAAKTKADIDKLYNTLSNKDKELLGDDKHLKEWLTLQEGEFVAKRIIKRHGDIPVAAVDIMTTTKPGHLTVAIMTDPKYRGMGYASAAAKEGLDWYNRYKKRMKVNELGWGAYRNNTASRAIAEKLGFEYDDKASNNEWTVYRHK